MNANKYCEKSSPEAARELAERQQLEARRNLYGVRLLQAGDAWKKENLDTDRILDTMQPTEGEPDLRWNGATSGIRPGRAFSRCPPGHEYRATATWSPSGEEFAVLADDRIQIWDTRRMRYRTHSYSARCGRQSSTRHWIGRQTGVGLLTDAYLVLCRILDAETGETLVELKHPQLMDGSPHAIQSRWQAAYHVRMEGDRCSGYTETGELIRTMFASAARANLAGYRRGHPNGETFAMI
ncbi:MAG: hypothetical protein R3C05_15800 [Pirellulaceae bacterium]